MLIDITSVQTFFVALSKFEQVVLMLRQLKRFWNFM